MIVVPHWQVSQGSSGVVVSLSSVSLSLSDVSLINLEVQWESSVTHPYIIDERQNKTPRFYERILTNFLKWSVFTSKAVTLISANETIKKTKLTKLSLYRITESTGWRVSTYPITKWTIGFSFCFGKNFPSDVAAHVHPLMHRLLQTLNYWRQPAAHLSSQTNKFLLSHTARFCTS